MVVFEVDVSTLVIAIVSMKDLCSFRNEIMHNLLKILPSNEFSTIFIVEKLKKQGPPCSVLVACRGGGEDFLSSRVLR